jgi:hypothetical protein
MDALQSLGTFFASPGGKGLESLAQLGATGAGLAGNISASHQQQQEADYLKKQQALLADPTKLAQEVAGATQPLNRALVQDVGNQVSGTLAEQGLSQAPGIQASTLATSLAPFEQQNQQTALQIVMQRLGLPIQYATALLQNGPKGTNLAPLLAMLSKGGAAGGGTGGGTNPAALMQLFQSAQMPNQQTSQAQLPSWLSPPPDSSSMGDFSLPDQTYA